MAAMSLLFLFFLIWQGRILSTRIGKKLVIKTCFEKKLMNLPR